MAYRTIVKALPRIGGQGKDKPMKQNVFLRYLYFQSGNLKSKIQNRKWAGIFAIILAFAFGGVVAEAQQTGKIFRIGFLDQSIASGSAVLLDAFRQELSKLGWIEGKNITFEYRLAKGKFDRLPGLAADLLPLKLDIIAATGGPTWVQARRNATKTIPIVIGEQWDRWSKVR